MQKSSGLSLRSQQYSNHSIMFGFIFNSPPPLCVCTRMCACPEIQKRLSDLLKLWVVVSCLTYVLGMELESSVRAVQALSP